MLKLINQTSYERLHSKENLIAYVKYSNGAIELHEDYVVFYKNWLPFQSFIYGRMATVINLSDIESVSYKGCGFFPAVFFIKLKGSFFPLRFFPRKWFPWTNFDLNPELREIYGFIFEKWTLSWKNDKYRKVQTLDDIKSMGVCPCCGENISKDSVFCDKCGTKLGEDKDE